MRGGDSMQEHPFTMSKIGDVVPADRPPRAIRVLVHDLSVAMNPVQGRSAGCSNLHRALPRVDQPFKRTMTVSSS